ncbi:MAG: secondary thiamine-phosphate synthase enzyme YjbQ [Candidatus Gastranaerophilaceae bacterium]
MTIITETFHVITKGFTDIVNLTPRVEEILDRLKIEDGQLLVHIPASTASITTIEYEPGLLKDLPAALEKLVPQDAVYKHDETWQDNNGYAHVRASILGNSKVFPIVKGELYNGKWQQIILIDFDNKPRTRNIVVQVVY